MYFSRREQPLTPHSFNTQVRFLPKAEPKKPRIVLSRLAFAQMTVYVKIAQEEVGWMGTVKRLPDGDFLIEKCFLFKQKVHATETEISTEGFSELSMELLNTATDDEDESNWEVNKLRFWGHSHVRMATGPSDTDQRAMLTSFGKGHSNNTGQLRFCFEECGYPWVIRGIFNKFGEANFDVYLYSEGLHFADVEWTVEDPSAEEIALQKQVDTLCLAIQTGLFPNKETTKPAKVATLGEPESDSSVCPQRKSPNTFGFGIDRELRYWPHITPELRTAIQQEFDKKVVSVRRHSEEPQQTKSGWRSMFQQRTSSAQVQTNSADSSTSTEQYPSEFGDEVYGRGSAPDMGSASARPALQIGKEHRAETPRTNEVRWIAPKPKETPKTTSISETLRTAWSELLDFLS